MLLSATITFIIFKILQYYYHTQVDYGDPLTHLRTFIYRIGDINFFLILFIPLSVLFFFLFTKRYSTYFNEISKGIHYLAQGNFHHQIEIQTNDEFNQIAKDMNQAGKTLQEAIERGDFSESSKDQLIVNLAHDLRTPLTSILGYLDLILKDDQLTTEQIRHFLTISYTKSQRLEKSLDELFEITRLNYGMLPIVKDMLNISDLLIQLNEELYPIYENNNLSTRLNIDPNLFVYGDGELLARVFENLLTNAVRYGYDGQYIDINGFRKDSEVIIQVINYGDMIPQTDMPHLFEVFYTGDRARTQQENSTGLGLFIAKNIVEQHEGKILAESDVIHTLFEVHLPFKDTSSADQLDTDAYI